MVYPSFYGAPVTFSYFYLKKKFCVSARVDKSLAGCLLSKTFRRPYRKNDISGYIWHKSFIETVKCSFFNQIIVYQSFYGAPLTLSFFCFKEKFCVSACVGKSLARCLLSKASKKWYLRFYLTQILLSIALSLTKQLFI